jgi:hypothetical protein
MTDEMTLPVMTISAATEQAELRTVLIAMANGSPLYEACQKAGISAVTARKRMAQYPEVLSDFKRANDALMRGQLLTIIEAQNKVIEKITEQVDLIQDPETLMRISSHLNSEADRIQSALNTEGSSRDDDVKKIMGIKRRPIASRMEININLNGERIEQTPPTVVIDAGGASQD